MLGFSKRVFELFPCQLCPKQMFLLTTIVQDTNRFILNLKQDLLDSEKLNEAQLLPQADKSTVNKTQLELLLLSFAR